ncbi:pyridoxal phosphate-dependent aminotransferase [Rhizobium leguminosarum]|uniref:pyridoxal phosphate-dependent aminotransferase n=1 Tax=Rhizobium leguminosarum TaxID=384 RepID=UPI000FEC8184|nr:pyridoxal phosphate-dependent aminotransferase [Rhizobium leguminosarum]RWX35218.1 pyridoxal phosphate-dependent aminotransferase [Rhizobium leguminosarum]
MNANTGLGKNPIAHRMTSVQPSASMAALADIGRLRSEGRDIISLTVGEPDFAPPQAVIEAMQDALRRGQTGYKVVNRPLVDAIRHRFHANNQLAYDDAQISVGTGLKQIIFAAFCATLNEGDEVVIPAPYWVSYPDIAKLYGGVPIEVPCTEDLRFKLTPGVLRERITERTRWLVLNSPNNPTGAVYSRKELSELGEVLRDYSDCLILSDEIYEHFIFGDTQFTAFAQANPDLLDRTLTANGVSKAYALAGMRLGYAAGPSWLIKAINSIISQDTSCAGTISQAGALAALTGDQSALERNRAVYEARSKRLVQALNAIPGFDCVEPQGAFYVFPSVAGLLGATCPDGTILETDTDVAAYFVQAAHVATMPGSAYGLSPYLRMSFATSDSLIDRACQQIASAVQRLTLANKGEPA